MDLINNQIFIIIKLFHYYYFLITHCCPFTLKIIYLTFQTILIYHFIFNGIAMKHKSKYLDIERFLSYLLFKYMNMFYHLNSIFYQYLWHQDFNLLKLLDHSAFSKNHFTSHLNHLK